jgi:hypothetical protein
MESNLFQLPLIFFLSIFTSCSHLSKTPTKNDRRISNIDEDSVIFTVVADIPYTEKEKEVLYNQIIPKLNSNYPEKLVLHLGDFKSGEESCTDDLLLYRKRQLYDISPGKVVYLPGDNDWTDCDKEKTDIKFDELERLSFLRDNFFDQPLKEDWNLIRDSEYVELAHWKIKSILFGSFHVVGTNNGRDEILIGDKSKGIRQVELREKANLRHLEAVFEKAVEVNSSAVVIASHADLFSKWYMDNYKNNCSLAKTLEEKEKCDGLASFRDKLRDLATKFSRPVLLIHGDSHQYCIDQPFKNVSNFFRVNTAGDYMEKDATVVTINPNSESSPFSVKGLLSEKNIPTECNQDWDQDKM